MPHPSKPVATSLECNVQTPDEEFEKDDKPANDDKPLLLKDDPASEKLQPSDRHGALVGDAASAQWVPHGAPPPQMRWRRMRALGFIAFAAFNFSIMSACVKYASRHVTSHETVFWRTSIAWLLNFVRA